MDRKYFENYKISLSGSRNHQKKDWDEYWSSLTEYEKDSLRNKARSKQNG